MSRQRIQSIEVENCLRYLLKKEGFTLSRSKDNGETGVDLLAEKGKDILHVEIIGYKTRPPQCSKDFYEVFFRAISRLNDGAVRCVIALPHQFERGFPQRVNHYRVAWERIGKAFPELEVWFVDIVNKSINKTKWKGWIN
jgi:hypothetical protein